MIFVLRGDMAAPGELQPPAPGHGTGNDHPAQNERQQKDHHQAISCGGIGGYPTPPYLTGKIPKARARATATWRPVTSSFSQIRLT